MTVYRTLPFCLCAVMFAAACAPLSIYHRTGTEVTRMQADLLACEVSALADAPVNTQIRQGPPRYIPARTYCDADNNCVVRGGFFQDGPVYTVDVNASLRQRLETQCMTGQGYSAVTLPNCPAGIARAAPKATTVTLPRLSDQSCAIRYKDGSWQIVNQAE